MRRVRRAFIMSLLAACGGGIGHDAGPLDGGAADGAAGGSCPITGTYRIERLICGGRDVTAETAARVPEITLSLAEAPDGCAAALSLRADQLFCSETERFTAAVMASSWNVTSSGVTECLIEGCTFGFDDAPCQ